jgi:hypothetical protein
MRTRKLFHKLGWKQLPTGAQISRWSPSFEHHCPSCGQEAEPDDHLFQCPHSLLCTQWRKDLLNTLHDSFSSFMDLDLFAIAKIGLTGYFQDVCPLFEERFPQAAYPALELTDQQTAIGWDQFICGKWSKL